MLEHVLLLGAVMFSGEDRREFTEDDLRRRGGAVVFFAIEGQTDASPKLIEDAVRNRLGWFKEVGVKADGKEAVRILLPPEYARYTELAAETIRRASVEFVLRIVADRRTHPREMEIAERRWPKVSPPKAPAELLVKDGANTIGEFVPYGRWVPGTDPDVIKRAEAFDLVKSPRRLQVDDKHRFVLKRMISREGIEPEGLLPFRKVDGMEWIVASDKTDIYFGTNELIRKDEFADPYIFLVHSPHDVGTKDVASAEIDVNEQAGLIVLVHFAREGAKRFERLTGDAIAKFDDLKRAVATEDDRFLLRPRLAIVVDGRVRSAPSLNSRISDKAQISGFSHREAVSVVGGLSPLPCRLRYVETKHVDPADASRNGSHSRNGSRDEKAH